MREHGGRLRQAASHYRIPLSDWLDLSTGINPLAWPAPDIPASCWSRLPEDEDGLEQAAECYYQVKHLLPVPGSQSVIQLLPKLRPRSRVAILSPTYNEHDAAWRKAGHQVTPLSASALDDAVAQSDVVVVANPNNPTGATFSDEQLFRWQQNLAARSGWLIVDEAFIDATPQRTSCPEASSEGLIVLRSLGKFFGLAGARVGFVFAEPTLLNQIREMLGPWSVNGPARWIATKALKDLNWQECAQAQLLANSQRLSQLLQQNGLEPNGGSALFQWVCTADAARLHDALARSGILCRLFTSPASLRFGLPGKEADWARLTAKLSELCTGLIEAASR